MSMENTADTVQNERYMLRMSSALLAITWTAQELKVFPGSQSAHRPGNGVVCFKKAELLTAAEVRVTSFAKNSTCQWGK